MGIFRDARLMYKGYDSLYNLIRKFSTYQAASNYKFWIIKYY